MKILASHGTKLGVLKGKATKSVGAAMQVTRAVGLLKMKHEEGKGGGDVDAKTEERGGGAAEAKDEEEEAGRGRVGHARSLTPQEISEAHKRELEEKAKEGSKFPYGKAASVTGTSVGLWRDGEEEGKGDERKRVKGSGRGTHQLQNFPM